MTHHRRYRPVLAALAVSAGLAACATPSTEPARLPAGEWRLDPDHASVTWQVRHMGLSWYTGRFDAIDASLSLDPAEPQDAVLTAIVEAGSISTGDPEFDADLAEDWLHAGRHPQLVFRSGRIEVTGETHGIVHGELTLNGQTVPVEMTTDFHGGLRNWLTGRNTLGFSGYFEIDRTDFGVDNLPQTVVGHQIRVNVEAEFLRQGETE